MNLGHAMFRRTRQLSAVGCAAVMLGASVSAHARGMPPLVAPGFAVPDNNPAGASSSVHVAETIGLLDTLSVRLVWPMTVAEGGHPWIGDLAATLTFTPDSGAPSQSLDLFRRVGAASSDSLGDSSDMRGTYQFSNFFAPFPPRNIWDDAAAVGFNQAVTGGPYPPSTRNASFQYEPLVFFNAFGAVVRPGTWTLNISDHAPGNTGRLVEWTIHYITPAPGTAGLFVVLCAAPLRRRR